MQDVFASRTVLEMTGHVCLLTDRSCNCDPAAATDKFRPCVLARRLGVFLRLGDLDKPGEAEGGPAMFIKEIRREGIPFSRVAALLETFEERKYSDTDAESIFARGLARGHRECGGRVLSGDFFDEDGSPRWQEIVKFCQNNPDFKSLKPNEQEFVDELPTKLRYRMPTRPMGGFLLSIFWKLRGSLR